MEDGSACSGEIAGGEEDGVGGDEVSGEIVQVALQGKFSNSGRAEARVVVEGVEIDDRAVLCSSQLHRRDLRVTAVVLAPRELGECALHGAEDGGEEGEVGEEVEG